MSTDDPDYPVEAPGWAAIDRACLAAHPEQVPHQFTSSRAYDLEGTSPLPAISVWEGERPTQWHYVGYGLSELFEKTSPVPTISGLGYEVCLRIPRSPADDTPPAWPLRLLQGIAHYAMSGHREIETGDVIDLGGPITGDDVPTELRGIALIPDPLGKIATPHGSVLFLLVVGLMPDEIELLHRLDPQRRVGLVREAARDGLTHPDRPSWTKDPRTQAMVRRYQLGILI
jgi:hypothetical protein